MYPYFELFGTQISMMFIGTIVAFIIFLVSARILTKRNHQDFLKLFYRLPGWIILSYILWRYTAFALETWTYFPSSISDFLTILSPHNFNFHFVWILIATRICLSILFSSIKRTENKKIRADIIFLSIANALIIFWILITLWDTIIWKPTDSIFAIRALTDNSALTKFDGVYPIWLFISFGVLAIHVIVSLLSIILKKNWIWIRWLIWILIILNITFFFQSYPRYWIVSILWTSFDIKQYLSLIVIISWIITAIKRENKRF
jgi:hypothetical protein